MKDKRFLLAFVGILGSGHAVPAVAEGQDVEPRPMICLALRLVPGEADPAGWGAVHHPPGVVALDSVELAARTSGRIEVRTGPDEYSRRKSGALFGDSLVLTWSNSLAGVHLRGTIQDSVYRGVARLITDVVTPQPLPDARFEGRRVDCPTGLSGRR